MSASCDISCQWHMRFSKSKCGTLRSNYACLGHQRYCNTTYATTGDEGVTLLGLEPCDKFCCEFNVVVFSLIAAGCGIIVLSAIGVLVYCLLRKRRHVARDQECEAVAYNNELSSTTALTVPSSVERDKKLSHRSNQYLVNDLDITTGAAAAAGVGVMYHSSGDHNNINNNNARLEARRGGETTTTSSSDDQVGKRHHQQQQQQQQQQSSDRDEDDNDVDDDDDPYGVNYSVASAPLRAAGGPMSRSRSLEDVGHNDTYYNSDINNYYHIKGDDAGIDNDSEYGYTRTNATTSATPFALSMATRGHSTTDATAATAAAALPRSAATPPHHPVTPILQRSGGSTNSAAINNNSYNRNHNTYNTHNNNISHRPVFVDANLPPPGSNTIAATSGGGGGAFQRTISSISDYLDDTRNGPPAAEHQDDE